MRLSRKLLTAVAGLGTLAMVGVDVDQAMRGLIPGVGGAEAGLLAIGMTGTTFSIVAAVYQTYLMREKGWTREDLAWQNTDCLLGIGMLGVISATVLMTSAAVIHGGGDQMTGVVQMAEQLEPLVGPAAFYLFSIGFFFASFSSLVVNPLIGATLLADGLGHDSRMDGRPVRRLAILGLGLGIVVVLMFDGPPLELIQFAQAVAVVAFPILGFLIVAIGRRRSVMNEFTTPWWIQCVLVLGFVVLLAIVLNYLRQIAAF